MCDIRNKRFHYFRMVHFKKNPNKGLNLATTDNNSVS